MGSGNSGSMQSSSGGDEEYDSRAESISVFLNSSGNFTSLSHHPSQPQPPPPTSHHHNHPSSTSFESLSNYFDAFPRSPPSNSNSLLNLDASWARTLRPSDQNCTDIGRLIGSSSSSMTSNVPPIPIPINPVRGSYSGHISISPPSSSSLMHSSAAPSDQPNPATPRSSKKRSRASRRAPTTVLTTDTSNFRAMVQEFTGIPAPPFSSSSFPRSRFDLFHAAASSAMRSPGLSDQAIPPYLLRPFAHKVNQVPSFGPFASGSSSSTMLDSTTTSSNNANNTITNATATTSTTTCTNTTSTNTTSPNNYQLPSDHLGRLSNSQHQNLLNMQNPLFNFQSILQSPPLSQKFNLAPVFGAKAQGPPMIPMGADYAMSGIGQAGHTTTTTTTQMGALPNLLGSDGMSSRGGGGGGGDNLSAWADSSESDGGNQVQLRSVGGNYSNSQRVNGCKMNYTASGSADFHAEKGSENVTARGEGMIDSWICSSD